MERQTHPMVTVKIVNRLSQQQCLAGTRVLQKIA